MEQKKPNPIMKYLLIPMIAVLAGCGHDACDQMRQADYWEGYERGFREGTNTVPRVYAEGFSRGHDAGMATVTFYVVEHRWPTNSAEALAYLSQKK